MTGTSLAYAITRNMQFFSGVAEFTPHDLRRTAASHMTAIGIPRLTVSKILNHADSSVTAIYDRHGYQKEKAAALEAWAAKLSEMIGADTQKNNIIPHKKAV